MTREKQCDNVLENVRRKLSTAGLPMKTDDRNLRRAELSIVTETANCRPPLISNRLARLQVINAG